VSPTKIDVIEAWQVCAGDELPGGIKVLFVSREVLGRTVRIVTDEPPAPTFPGIARLQWSADCLSDLCVRLVPGVVARVPRMGDRPGGPSQTSPVPADAGTGPPV
jgi:hypothetical protein